MHSFVEIYQNAFQNGNAQSFLLVLVFVLWVSRRAASVWPFILLAVLFDVAMPGLLAFLEGQSPSFVWHVVRDQFSAENGLGLMVRGVFYALFIASFSAFRSAEGGKQGGWA